ncbi:hypothetical protein B0H14DRAFT_2594436 [Mycena olivaceomarginata]|nr:hypothetical protein B0H14DRAFT_2594436 [Mycena olivaceomarginata]
MPTTENYNTLPRYTSYNGYQDAPGMHVGSCANRVSREIRRTSWGHLGFNKGRRKSKPATEFKIKSNGQRGKTCRDCSDRGRDAARDEKQNEKENIHDGDLEDEEAGQDDNLELEARVDITSISGGRREKADLLAKRIWNRMKYRFVEIKSWTAKITKNHRKCNFQLDETIFWVKIKYAKLELKLHQ